MGLPVMRFALPVLMSLVLTSGAAAASDIPARIQSAPGDPVSFSRITVRPDSRGILVSGYVSRPFGKFGVLTGHIAVAAVGEDGGTIDSGRAALSQVSTRSPRRTAFVVHLKSAQASQVRLITVQYQAKLP